MSGGLGRKVCVVGAGAAGLVALKNFLEEGFDATAFEKSPYVGGLWHVSDDRGTHSALDGTICNFSKHGMTYSDFPHKEGTSTLPTAAEMSNYFEDYVDHFALRDHIRLGATITHVERDDKRQKWMVSVKTTTPNRSDAAKEEVHEFDRLLICTGLHAVPKWPALPNREVFKGEIIHAHQFKSTDPFAGKNVLFVGISATAADLIGILRRSGVAKKIYVSHRKALVIIPTIIEGKPIDTFFSRRSAVMMSWMRAVSPHLQNWFMMTMLGKLQNKLFPWLKRHVATQILPGSARTRMDPEVHVPCVSESLAEGLRTGDVQSVNAIRKFVGPRAVELTDGTVLDDVDAVVCATGAHPQVSGLLPPSADPFNPAFAPDGFAKLKSAKHYTPDVAVARLYRNILSLQYPHSLAMCNYAIIMKGWLPLAELETMGITQLWGGKYTMPSSREMEQDADRLYAKLVKSLNSSNIMLAGGIKDYDWETWFHRVAGTGIPERLGSWSSWQSWKLWWQDPKLYKMCMDGVDSPHMLRLFETGRGRKPWEGAREAMEKANAAINEGEARWKKEQAALKEKKG